MTIKHDEIRISEIGDNTVMKTSLDDAFITVFMKHDVKPSFVVNGMQAVIRVICSVLAFYCYFQLKDYFPSKDLILVLCLSYALLSFMDTVLEKVFIKGAFLVGSLPTGSKYCNAKDFRISSKCPKYDYNYTLTLSCVVDNKIIQYDYVKPVCSYYEKDGLLRTDIVEAAVVEVMDAFREELRKGTIKKRQ